MPTIFETDAAQHRCPYNDFNPCLGATCMAWQWNGPVADRCETDNLVDGEDGQRPLGSPKAPDGEGWLMDGPTFSKSYHRSAKDKLPPATAQRWTKPRPKQEGQCSRHPGDDQYDRW